MNLRRIFFLLILAFLFSFGASAAEKGQGEPLITMDVKDAEVRAVVTDIVAAAGLNVVFEDGVKGKVTVKFDKAPWKDALYMVLRSKNLVQERKGNIIFIRRG